MRADGMKRSIREAVEGRSCYVWAAKRKRRTAMAARSKGPQISEARGGIVPIVKSERAFKGRFCSLGVAHRELASARRPPRRWKIGPNSAVTYIPLRPTRGGSPTPQALRAIVTPYLKPCYEKSILFRRLAWWGEVLSFDRTAPPVNLTHMGWPRAARRGLAG